MRVIWFGFRFCAASGVVAARAGGLEVSTFSHSKEPLVVEVAGAGRGVHDSRVYGPCTWHLNALHDHHPLHDHHAHRSVPRRSQQRTGGEMMLGVHVSARSAQWAAVLWQRAGMGAVQLLI
ncbi:hypothetical protein BJ138DRAFT_422864 [Hygrophoropsis aurantiaca]|uniref:Uncharacterized protein n=1 Tax=Hygrophoropsis aurantiaca TaxID=72124 RepID=A0ACB8A576_9AGAM|nr:hypothetical protein BJ138DRAFT_422864 [Hygrophoropsis aurantiaca]